MVIITHGANGHPVQLHVEVDFKLAKGVTHAWNVQKSNDKHAPSDDAHSSLRGHHGDAVVRLASKEPNKEHESV